MSIITIPNAITGFRLILFAIFIYLAHLGLPILTALFFFLAWGLDAVDGFVARALKQETDFGYVFDKVVDRLVVAVGLLVLLTVGLVPAFALLLVLKDFIVGPLVIKRGSRGLSLVDLGFLGKIVATGQGLALLWLLLRWPYAVEIVVTVSLVGVIAGLSYWRRAKV